MNCLGLQQLSSEINLTFFGFVAVYHWIKWREVHRLWPPYVLIQSRDVSGCPGSWTHQLTDELPDLVAEFLRLQQADSPTDSCPTSLKASFLWVCWTKLPSRLWHERTGEDFQTFAIFGRNLEDLKIQSYADLLKNLSTYQWDWQSNILFVNLYLNLFSVRTPFWSKDRGTVSLKVRHSGFYVSNYRNCGGTGMSFPLPFISLLTQQWQGFSSEEPGSLTLVRLTYRNCIKHLNEDLATCLTKEWHHIRTRGAYVNIWRKALGIWRRAFKVLNCFFSAHQVHSDCYSVFFSLNPAKSIYF